MERQSKLLIVDDSPGDIRILANLLAGMATIMFATSGQEALAKAAEEDFDVILLDIVLPDIDGFEVCRRLNKRAGGLQAPIIFVTVLDDVSSEEKGLSLGALDYVSKPFVPAVVRARVRNHIALSRTAKELRAANEQLAAAKAATESALAGEQLANQRLRTFIDMATHEFKTPLATIDSAAQLLELYIDQSRETVASPLRVIRKSVRRLVELIETCLTDERTENLPVRFRQCLLSDIVEPVIDRHPAGRISVEMPDAPAECTADPELLGIALDALLDNALRYAPAHQPVTLSAIRDAGTITMAVSDRGPGVPPEEAEHIFEKYYRGSASPGVSGTGLGLHLVKTIAVLHGGGVAYRSRPGGGGVFLLTVPAEPRG